MDLKVAKSANKAEFKKARFAGNPISIDCSFLIDNGAPEPKLCKFNVLLIANPKDAKHKIVA